MALAYRFMIIGVLFALVGMSIGIWMGISGPATFNYAAVHAHVNLVGWVSHFIYGLYYRGEPINSRGALPQTHFWLAFVGAILLVIGILGHVAMEEQVPAILGIPTTVLAHGVEPGSLLSIGGMLLFLFIVIRGSRAS
jgi:hypothetical protein